MPLTPKQKAYLAGIIDGEGCIFLSRSNARDSSAYFYPQVKVANTDYYLKDLNRRGPGGLRYGNKITPLWVLAEGNA